MDTSDDPPLPKVDLANQKWTGEGGDVPSWGRPYPTPRPAAIVNVGARRADVWHCIRALGKVNQWSQRDGAGLMAIEGDAGVSAGNHAAANRCVREWTTLSAAFGIQDPPLPARV